VTTALRRVALVSLGAIGVLAMWLAVQQAIAGSQYRDDPRNTRSVTAEPRRGVIRTADGVVVAEDAGDGRRYPRRGDYLHLVGYRTPEGGSGLEASRDADLRPRDDGSITSWLLGLLGADLEPPEVRLTVHDTLQQAAVAGLGGRTGAVVALDPRTGAVLAYVSSPTLDPNDLVGGSLSAAEARTDPAALDRVAFRLLPPGSTFKTLVAAAALDAGMRPGTAFPDRAEYLAPGAGRPIRNAGGGRCGPGSEITMRRALAVSCNTVFASLAVELGGVALAEVGERAGFNALLPFELGAAVSSLPGSGALDADPGALAQTGLGERDVRATPLQMAVITAGIANGGVAMRPFVVDAVVAGDGREITSASPDEWRRVFSPRVASALVEMMVDVVAEGTGRAAGRADVVVAGKTGTAEGGGGPHAWFIGFAPAENPTIAIAVVVEGGGAGGTVAAPIAAAVLEAWFGAQDP
jgi:peptidoglycan glycosyltransferase